MKIVLIFLFAFGWLVGWPLYVGFFLRFAKRAYRRRHEIDEGRRPILVATLAVLVLFVCMAGFYGFFVDGLLASIKGFAAFANATAAERAEVLSGFLSRLVHAQAFDALTALPLPALLAVVASLMLRRSSLEALRGGEGY